MARDFLFRSAALPPAPVIARGVTPMLVATSFREYPSPMRRSARLRCEFVSFFLGMSSRSLPCSTLPVNHLPDRLVAQPNLIRDSLDAVFPGKLGEITQFIEPLRWVLLELA